MESILGPHDEIIQKWPKSGQNRKKISRKSQKSWKMTNIIFWGSLLVLSRRQNVAKWSFTTDKRDYFYNISSK